MLRAAAKNYQDVVVLVDPADYHQVLTELETNNRFQSAPSSGLQPRYLSIPHITML